MTNKDEKISPISKLQVIGPDKLRRKTNFNLKREYKADCVNS